MTAETNPAVGKQPVAIEWESLTNEHHSWSLKRLPFDEGCAKLLQEAFRPKYDPEFHKLSKVVWDDGSFSYASTNANQFEELVRVVSAADNRPLINLYRY